MQKCLHGKTQNQNESLNGMVWQRIPKEIYVGRETLELGLYDAVSYFNIGSISIIKLFQALGIPSGKYTIMVADSKTSLELILHNIKAKLLPRSDTK